MGSALTPLHPGQSRATQSLETPGSTLRSPAPPHSVGLGAKGLLSGPEDGQSLALIVTTGLKLGWGWGCLH